MVKFAALLAAIVAATSATQTVVSPIHATVTPACPEQSHKLCTLCANYINSLPLANASTEVMMLCSSYLRDNLIAVPGLVFPGQQGPVAPAPPTFSQADAVQTGNLNQAASSVIPGYGAVIAADGSIVIDTDGAQIGQSLTNFESSVDAVPLTPGVYGVVSQNLSLANKISGDVSAGSLAFGQVGTGNEQNEGKGAMFNAKMSTSNEDKTTGSKSNTSSTFNTSANGTTFEQSGDMAGGSESVVLPTTPSPAP